MRVNIYTSTLVKILRFLSPFFFLSPRTFESLPTLLPVVEDPGNRDLIFSAYQVYFHEFFFVSLSIFFHLTENSTVHNILIEG